MVEFQLAPDIENSYSSFGPLDPADDKIEEPIIPLSDIGTTVPETDPATNANILRNIEANIRKGASKMQIVMTTPHHNAIGGRPKAYGKAVRQAIREMLEANKVEITGFEMPTSSMNNLSGFDHQRWSISEEKRKKDIQEVKDAIDFAADVAGGGGIDLVSMEFARNISDSRWNNNKYGRFFDYTEDEIEYEKLISQGKDPMKVDPERFGKIESIKVLYDGRSGNIIKDIRKNKPIVIPKWMNAQDIQKTLKMDVVGKWDPKRAEANNGDGYIKSEDLVDINGNWIDPTNPDDSVKKVAKWNPDKTKFESEILNWFDIVKKTEEWNKKHPEKKMTPEKMAFQLTVEGEVAKARGQSLYYSQGYEENMDQIRQLNKEKNNIDRIDEKEISQIKNKAKEYENNIKRALEEQNQHIDNQYIKDQAYEMAAREAAEKMRKKGININDKIIKEIINKGKNKIIEDINRGIKATEQRLKHIHEAAATADAQAEELLDRVKNVKTLNEIGLDNTTNSYAELGFYAYKKSQSKKVKKDLYVGPELGWPTTFGGHPEEFREIILKARKKMSEKLKREGIDEKRASELAKKHIKGTFDTSHLAMWYNHFDWKRGETEEQRLKRFNKWFLEEVKKLAKDDIIGEIQVVDSITGQHSHLPPGQGIFPVVEAVKLLKKHGFKGAILSEGHEHERFKPGSTLTDAWSAFGAPIGTYWSGVFSPQTWGGVSHSYFGATRPPTYIVGAYVPSNEWTLWSEVPFE